MQAFNFIIILLLITLGRIKTAQAEPVSCDEFNRQVSCASRPPERKTTEEELYQELENNGATNRFFRTDVPSPTLVTGQERKEFIHKLWSNLKDFEEHYFCEGSYDVSTHWVNYDTFELDQYLAENNVESNHASREKHAEEYNLSNAVELNSKLDQLLDTVQNCYQVGSQLTYCTKQPKSSIGFTVSELDEPCIFEVSRNLPNNEYYVAKYIDEIQNSENFKAGMRCLRGKEQMLSHITIIASSNALNNTTPDFCKKDFLGLSKARAEQARDVLLPIILNGAGNGIPIELNYQGSNKNGTSGPCPYRLKENGKEEIIPGFLENPITKSDLEKAKYLMIRIEFKEKSEALTNQIFHLDHRVPCGSLKLSCKH